MKMDFKKVEKKWQQEWEKKKIFEVKEGKGKKFYCLEMYPYPSASFLHMGHVRNYTIGDVYARFKRMNGFNVLYPMGYDSFGLPAETAAKKEGTHPKEYTEKAIKKVMEYQKSLGNSYDWSRSIASHEPDYYRWNQFFFLKMLEKGLAYRKKAPVNFCEKCESVLANEEAEGGKCWRCGNEVVQKDLEQWFFKITDYADRLLKDLNKIDWPERIKTMQENWIGKSYGVEIMFEIDGEKWPVFTTRPDTIFGVTFMVISAKHPKLIELADKNKRKEVERFAEKCKKAEAGDLEKLDKEGVFIGKYAVNPITNEKIPVYAGNFVLSDYGCGMVMAVPCHDQRDFEFAKKYKIGMNVVIQPDNGKLNEKQMNKAYTGEGILVNSGKFNGLNSRKAIEEITKYLESKNIGKKTVNYKIKDWLISRQRYWGTPIPVIYCEKCGIVPVREEELPVLLPEKVDFKVTGNPLSANKGFVNAKCPKCGKIGRRETDTMGGFVDSSWYFLRYCDSKNKKQAFDSKKVEHWMPVDQYIGGAEHAVMHLIYARFFIKVLKDLGFVKFDEPFAKLFNQGILYKDGAKMSKSKGNVVFQTDISEKYGIDTARLFLMFVSSPDKQMEWSDEGVEGSYRIINRIIRMKDNLKNKSNVREDSKVNIMVKRVTEAIEKFEYPRAIVSVIETIDSFSDGISKKNYESLLKIISPFCPHVAEELWHEIGNKSFVSLEKWPAVDEKKIDEKFEEQEQASDKLVGDILNIIKIIKEKQGKEAEKVFVYVLPKEIDAYNKKEIEKKVGKKVEIYSVSDKKKYDPEGKAGKAKPNKPAVYLE
ncbi:leucine--tRNA ligase [Candidatus Woesearchaeota archaeon CG10_big_fil_rev_8_21_14_0_10_34_12]|nr:MAG: leucine--tRNA ligase [Candidatus Woesearchaeota archaeon CG10_big_fil_rev_8_21_14_0_10_34_12]